MKTMTKIIIAGVAGLAIGVAIGMLFAPEKGSKSRKRLKKKILEFTDTIENEFKVKNDNHLEEEPTKS